MTDNAQVRRWVVKMAGLWSVWLQMSFSKFDSKNKIKSLTKKIHR